MTNTSEQVVTGENAGRGTEKGQKKGQQTIRRLSRTHFDVWYARLRKRSYTDRKTGKSVEIPDWQIRLKKDGGEGRFNLGTANQADAAKKAKEIFTFLDANGWPATLAKYKPDSEAAPRRNLTIGDYLKAVDGTDLICRRTFLNYQNCFRTIVSETFGIKGNKTKYDHRQGGNHKWAARIDRVRLQRLTPTLVARWQKRRIKQAGDSPVAIATAKRTTNSYVRCARSLFSPDIRKRLKGVQLPAILPFDGVELQDSGSMKYVSKVNVYALIAAARQELKSKEPEVYKVFLLGLFAGMRRGEIDLAEWQIVDWQNSAINLEETEWLHLKTKDSAGVITIDSEVLAELRELMPGSKSPFIITSDRPPRNNSPRPYYRCDPVFDRLSKWLRSKGVKANKPLHELRKEIGALIATEHGIYAASRFLRHSDITTTARHYADHKARISVGLGKLLDTGIKAATTPTAVNS